MPFYDIEKVTKSKKKPRLRVLNSVEDLKLREQILKANYEAFKKKGVEFTDDLIYPNPDAPESSNDPSKEDIGRV